MAEYTKDYNSVPQIGFTQTQMNAIKDKELADNTAKVTAYNNLPGEASTGFNYNFTHLPDPYDSTP